LVSNDEFLLQQRVEGFNFADMDWGTANAKTVALSFWVRSSLTGSFGGAFRNDANNRSYPFSYSISAANTWEQKTIVVPGDTTGTWVGATNGVGLKLIFSLGAGASFSGTASAWAASELAQPTGSVSVVGTSGATFYITGVQLEAGSVATPFERRPYGTELALCMRYYGSLNTAFEQYYSAWGPGIRFSYYTAFPTQMRVAPTITFNNLAAELTNSDGAAFVSVNGFAYLANIIGSGSASRHSQVFCSSEL
jgi:hypothetical protein